MNAPPDLRIAVIGAGLSGLACARALADEGHAVHVFDKARGPGGRMSTRRAETLRFDHGAQYFTVRDASFASQVEAWCADGVAAPWLGRIVTIESGEVTRRTAATPRVRYVGVPGMSAICRHLADGLEVTFATRIEGLRHIRDAWRLTTDDGVDLGRFDGAVVSAPAPQAAALLRQDAPAMAERAAAIPVSPCWAVMVAFPSPLDVGFDAAFVHGAPVSWVARGGSKPGRPDAEAWVLHGTPAWSARHLDADRDVVARHLLEAFGRVVGVSLPAPTHLSAHPWRYALPTDPGPEPCLVDGDLRLVACGDWCGGPRVEGAWLSGRAAAEQFPKPASPRIRGAPS